MENVMDDELGNQQYFLDCFYHQPSAEELQRLRLFLRRYEDRLKQNSISLRDSQRLMSKNNPQFILRNYLLFEAIEDLENENAEKFNQLWEALQNPYQKAAKKLTEKRPKKYDLVYGCSQLSCSS